MLGQCPHSGSSSSASCASGLKVHYPHSGYLALCIGHHRPHLYRSISYTVIRESSGGPASFFWWGSTSYSLKMSAPSLTHSLLPAVGIRVHPHPALCWYYQLGHDFFLFPASWLADLFSCGRMTSNRPVMSGSLSRYWWAFDYIDQLCLVLCHAIGERWVASAYISLSCYWWAVINWTSQCLVLCHAICGLFYQQFYKGHQNREKTGNILIIRFFNTIILNCLWNRKLAK